MLDINLFNKIFFRLCCQGEIRQLLGESTLHCLLQANQETITSHLIKISFQLKSNPIVIKLLLDQCNELLISSNLIWTKQ